MRFQILGQRYQPYAPIVLEKDVNGVGKAGDVLDDGQPKPVKLGSWSDKAIAESMANNIKSHMPKRSWKVWVEEIK